MKMKSIITASLMVLLMVSCETFPDGGSVKRADKNLEGTWELSTYLRDGSTANDVFITNYVETFKEGGVFERSYTKADQSVVNETGSWSMDSDNLTINISEVSSISDFSDTNSTLSTSEYVIVRLKGKEFWFEYENGGNQHEFQMSKR